MTNTKPEQKEKSLLEIFHMIYRRKLILIFSVFISLILAYFYTKNTAPVFESTAKLKKEVADRRQAPNDILDIAMMQTRDETEQRWYLLKPVKCLVAW
jgi:LPS O-antigen subunit length determinant protein (WzzB/FepE family)